MGNSLVGGKNKKKKRTNVMKVSGETLKLKTPVTAAEVVKDYPGHVVLESEAVKHFGVRARPLEGHQALEPRRVYFLVELPKDQSTVPRRVRSGIQMSAQDRLESLVLSRRSASDLSMMKSTKTEDDDGKVRVKVRLPKADMERLLNESQSQAEAAAKIMDLCLLDKKQPHWPSWDHPHAAAANITTTNVVAGGEGFKSSKKRVSFLPVKEVNQIAVAS